MDRKYRTADAKQDEGFRLNVQKNIKQNQLIAKLRSNARYFSVTGLEDEFTIQRRTNSDGYTKKEAEWIEDH